MICTGWVPEPESGISWEKIPFLPNLSVRGCKECESPLNDVKPGSPEGAKEAENLMRRARPAGPGSCRKHGVPGSCWKHGVPFEGFSGRSALYHPQEAPGPSLNAPELLFCHFLDA